MMVQAKSQVAGGVSVPVILVFHGQQAVYKVNRILGALWVLHQGAACSFEVVTHHLADEAKTIIQTLEQRVHAGKVVVLVLLQQHHQA